MGLLRRPIAHPLPTSATDSANRPQMPMQALMATPAVSTSSAAATTTRRASAAATTSAEAGIVPEAVVTASVVTPAAIQAAVTPAAGDTGTTTRLIERDPLTKHNSSVPHPCAFFWRKGGKPQKPNQGSSSSAGQRSGKTKFAIATFAALSYNSQPEEPICLSELHPGPDSQPPA